MRTVVLEPLPVEVAELIERRQRLGLDLHDEVWEGTYHMAPAARFRHADLDQQLAEVLGPLARAAGLIVSGPFNLGDSDSFRVPGRGLHRGDQEPGAVYLDTAAMVVEIVSPGDETWDKLDFYAGHGVDELLVVDPGKRKVHVLALAAGAYAEAGASALLTTGAPELEAALRWT
ncbi:MAG: Uma2 family endonuclease [Acidimicrobiales bacterium]